MKRILVGAAMACFSAAAFAQTVTVDASNGSPNGTTTFNNLQSALASFATAASTGGAGTNNGNAAPNIINVAPGTPVDGTACVDAVATAGRPELLIMDGDITIQGAGGVRATIVGQNLVGNALNAGLVWRQDVNLTLNDLAIIPSATNTPNKCCYFRMTGNVTSTTITMNRVILTSNNGSGAPVTTTGQDNPSLSTPVIPLPAGGDGMYLVGTETVGGQITGNLNDVIIASYAASGASDGIITFSAVTASNFVNIFCNLNAGCIIANAPRFGIQTDYGAVTTVNGTSAKPVVIRNTGADGIWDNSTAAKPTVVNVNYANFFSINGSPIKEQETGGLGFINTVTNTKISSATASGIAFYSNGTPPAGYATSTATVDKVVVHDTGNSPAPAGYDNNAGQIAAPVYTDTSGHSSNRTVTVTSATLSGTKSGLVGIYNGGTGVFNVSNSAFSTSGANALQGGTTAGSGTINVSSSTNGNITYANTTNPHAANFLVPAVAPPASAAKDWEMFE